MPESFLRRWARRKTEATASPRACAPAGASVDDAPPAAANASTASADPVTPAQSLQDIAHLTADSDYSAFLAKGVDKTVRRAALKKLFADPHFNAMDGLDIYIGDYARASPLTPAMLTALAHAKGILDPQPLHEPGDERTGGGTPQAGVPDDTEDAPARKQSVAPGHPPPDMKAAAGDRVCGSNTAAEDSSAIQSPLPPPASA